MGEQRGISISIIKNFVKPEILANSENNLNTCKFLNFASANILMIQNESCFSNLSGFTIF